MSADNFKLPSGKELIVLQFLVTSREMYGLEMVKASNKLARGTVYVLLGRMEDKGFITSRKEKEEGRPGMPKRLYKITGLGQRAYAAWRRAQEVYMGAPVFAGGG